VAGNSVNKINQWEKACYMIEKRIHVQLYIHPFKELLWISVDFLILQLCPAIRCSGIYYICWCFIVHVCYWQWHVHDFKIPV